MNIFHWIWFILTGFVVGLIARAVLPGSDKMGIIWTTVVGILGSLLGGFVGELISKPIEGATFHPAGFIRNINAVFPPAALSVAFEITLIEARHGPRP